MDRWLTKLSEDTSKDSQIVKVRRAKPADLTDACWTRGDFAAEKIAEKQTRDSSNRCEARSIRRRRFRARSQARRSPATSSSARSKPIQAADYKVQFTADELARLKKVFPDGVCDWSRTGSRPAEAGRHVAEVRRSSTN